MTMDPTDVRTHFAFGRNWASYANLIGEAEITEAVKSLRRLSGADLTGRSFLDIGCGSGLHSLAAIRLGASRVVALDIDDDSVATTTAVLGRFAAGAAYSVERRSVFDVTPEALGDFDVVYSWGVLHHTGDMKSALERAAAMVAGDGMLLLALYRRTYLCPLWTLEKKWYASASARAQKRAQRLFISWFKVLASLVAMRGRLAGARRQSDATEGAGPTFADYVKRYGVRGMDFHHDVHDWLGGYPYESALPDEVDALMRKCGLRSEAVFLCRKGRARSHGLLGSGCDEYRYVRDSQARTG